MDIGKRETASWIRPLLVVIMLMVAFGGGLLWERAGAWAAMVTVWQQTTAQLDPGSDLPVLSIDIPFPNYTDLLAQREEALATGVFIAGESDFVNADVSLEGEQVPVRLRLQQGTAMHLGEDEKWNLDVRTRADTMLRGMSRFYLIDPADNQWLQEWAFLATVRREGLLAGRYQFVRLIVNGDDRGIYALQEGFAPPLLAANGRSPGVIVEFDAESLWRTVRRFGGDVDAAIADPITNLGASDFQFFAIDTFQETSVADDATLSAQQAAAEDLLRGLQSGTLPATAVFDVTQYGRFLALVDLWGTTGTTALTNLRYYYDPEQGRLQPIAFNGHAETGRISPAMTYYDPQLQLAYAQAIAHYSDPAFLAELEAALDEEWQLLQTAVATEVSQSPPWERLAAQQTILRNSLNPPQPVLAYFDPVVPTAANTQPIYVANPLNLPVEIVGFDVDGATFLEIEPAWLVNGTDLLTNALPGVVLSAHAGGETAVLRYARFELPLRSALAQDVELAGQSGPDIWVATRVAGSDEVVLTAVGTGTRLSLTRDNPEANNGTD
ncbi:MAG: hypothetical protein GY943_00960 [Chloroflexi bacterium]|nr:hypothetical protein [Chloroflexota bacterium]